jgi:hypothetical protein
MHGAAERYEGKVPLTGGGSGERRLVRAGGYGEEKFGSPGAGSLTQS